MKRYIKILVLVTFLLGVTNQILAQIPENDIVLKAVKTEVDRSLKELKKDSLQKPFFISVKVNETDYRYNVATTFGKVHFEKKEDKVLSRKADVKLCVGNYHRNGNYYYSGIPLPVEDSSVGIRTALWDPLDKIYRAANSAYVNRMNELKQEKQTEEDKALDDFEKRDATVLIQPIKKEDYDISLARKYTVKLGEKLFEKVKKEKLEVENIETSFSFAHHITRYYDTEGSVYKYPTQRGSLRVDISGVNKEGQDINVHKYLSVKELSQINILPSTSKVIDELIEEYTIKYNAEYGDEPYIGPLLIVGDGVEYFIEQLINNLYTKRKTRYTNGNRYQKLKGVRIISNQLSLKIDYSDKAKNDKLLRREFEPIDNEAVIPPDSIVLIKNGKLLDMLSTREPTKEYKKSNGNNVDSRYKLNGIITFSGNEQYSYDELVKMLIDEAKLQGLEYAYIIGKYHSKINVETGEITRLRGHMNIDELIKPLRRVIGTENKQVRSTDGSISYPHALLLEDFEMKQLKYNRRIKKDFVSKPKVY